MQEALVDAVFMPKARLAEGLALGGCGVVSASMDSSDGLAWTLHELARLSNVGFELDKVPVAPEVKRFAELNSLDASELALYGGEEYELVVTVKPEKWDDAVAAVEAVGGKLLPIGKVTEEKQILAQSTVSSVQLKRAVGSTSRAKFSLLIQSIIDYCDA